MKSHDFIPALLAAAGSPKKSDEKNMDKWDEIAYNES